MTALALALCEAVTAQARTMGYCYRSNLNQPFLLLKVAVT